MKDIIWFCVKWTLITCLILISIGAPVRFFDLLYVGTFRYVMVDRHWLEDQTVAFIGSNLLGYEIGNLKDEAAPELTQDELIKQNEEYTREIESNKHGLD